ncbi:12674_t:CDS:2 [Entrophospora sp. SA101]|nr:12674_t:CDS:2 [Entrophospora sp. SA101]
MIIMIKEDEQEGEKDNDLLFDEILNEENEDDNSEITDDFRNALVLVKF